MRTVGSQLPEADEEADEWEGAVELESADAPLSLRVGCAAESSSSSDSTNSRAPATEGGEPWS